ncbi:Pentatricopeptide repeat-containing protein [Arachis hypogaea]|nr:Pentatricopeptide repeat-containing protein [Arachis hypogaea]
MYLRDGCSLLLKVRKPSIPLVLNTNPIFNLESNSQPQPTNAPPVEEFHVLKRLKHERDIGLALEYFKSLANSGAFKHTQFTYQLMIEKLGRNCEMDGVQYLLQQMKLEGVACSEDLFICVMNSYRRAGLADQALKMFYRIREFGCKPTVKIYNHLLDALLGENRFQMISPVYNNMKGEGLEPNGFTYNMLLKALCKNGKVDGACKLLEEMSNKGCPPDAVSYTTIVSSVCKLGQVEKAKELAKGFAPVVPVYNALINGFCKEYKIKEAFGLLNEMVFKGIDPNVISYSTIISCLSDMGNIDLSVAAFAQMLKRGCSPNIHTYSSLIKGYLLGGKLGEALELWNLMIMEGVKPNVVSYNALIHGLCCIGNMADAISICNQMERSSCSPNVTTYSTLISGFAKAGDLLGASAIWNKMINCGCHPNVVVYTTMVDALCQMSMFNQVHRLIENMVADGCPPNVVTFNTLIKGLCANGRVEGAMSVLHQMEKYDCLPNIRTYNELLDGLFRVNRFREACGLIKDIEDRNVELNTVTYNIIMHGFSSVGMQERVFQILAKMLVNGVNPDAITVNIIIHAYSKLGKVRTAMQILDKYTEEKELYPDIISHTCILWGICNWLGTEEAIVYLHNKMLSKGIFPNVATWDVLIRDASTKAPSWPVGVDGIHPPTKIPIPVPPSPSAKGDEPQRRPLQLSEQGQVLEIAIETAANAVLDLKDSLNDWDSKMYRGAKAILEDIKNYPLNDAAETVNEIGSTIRRAMGGTSGIIDTIFCKAAYTQLKPSSGSVVMPKQWAEALAASIAAVTKYGGASAGYRTLLDALLPASSVLQEKLNAGENPITAFVLSSEAALTGAELTKKMQAQAGRSTYVSSELLSTVPDPGAMAVATWYRVAALALQQKYKS